MTEALWKCILTNKEANMLTIWLLHLFIIHGPAKSCSKTKMADLGNILKTFIYQRPETDIYYLLYFCSNTIGNAKEDICMLLCNKIQVLAVVQQSYCHKLSIFFSFFLVEEQLSTWVSSISGEQQIRSRIHERTISLKYVSFGTQFSSCISHSSRRPSLIS